MKVSKLSRCRFMMVALALAPCAVIVDARLFEPTWLRIKRLRLTTGKPTCRFVHFTDLHHKGDRHFAQSVVNTINSWAPDFVCFTGDLIEDGKFLAETLEILAGVKSPMYGVPGNHDYWSRVSFAPISKMFRRDRRRVAAR